MSAFTKAIVFSKHEFWSVLPPTVYFLATFNIVVLTTSLVLDQYKVPVAFHASATILALLVGKVVLIVAKISLIRQFDRKVQPGTGFTRDCLRLSLNLQ